MGTVKNWEEAKRGHKYVKRDNTGYLIDNYILRSKGYLVRARRYTRKQVSHGAFCEAPARPTNKEDLISRAERKYYVGEGAILIYDIVKKWEKMECITGAAEPAIRAQRYTEHARRSWRRKALF